MEIRDWLLTISMLGHFSYTLWAYLDKRNDKTNQRIAALTAEVAALDSDMTALKASAENAPNHGDLGKVYEAIKAQGEMTNATISSLAATVNQLVGENRGQTDTLRLILNRITEKGLP
ncbi:MAG: hypothetical protein WAV95_15910 [Azonexus sp.]